jgi:energy-coupling factor transporter ATP-binding protein EcfA2
MAAVSGQQNISAGRDSYAVEHGNMIIFQAGSLEDSSAPFLIVDRSYLDQERQKPREPYIARPPTWADVVHGANADTRFLERDRYGSLLSEIRRLLLEPLHRGSDRRLPALFVTGAPGCGKSTLVRHVAAALVDFGEAVVADLGVNHGGLWMGDVASYAQGLADLSQSGMPVLLLMDDPFFADSGWDLLLERLGRPNYSNIAALGASPTYLYDAYAPRTSGQVVLNKFDLGSTTQHERVTFAQMYGIEGEAVQNSDEDLLVFAMETVARTSFDEIINRIWSTLNDGIRITRRSQAEDVQWPVMAFLLTSYLHRYYVMCPEPLLRGALLRLSQNTQTNYVSELSELTLSEGWHIFRIFRQASSARPISLIGTMHPRVAECAWQARPVRTIDPADWLASASIDVPDCVPQLADFILACQATIDPQDRRFAQRVAELWHSDRVPTAQLAALVKAIRSSPPAGELFRRSLRERLRRRDSESWLAAVELINLARRGSPGRDHLEQVDLPSSLKIANLAAGPTVAINVLGDRRNPARRRVFVETLCASLEGGLGWEIDDILLIWLLRNHDTASLRSLLPKIYEWLEGHPGEERARVALIGWFKGWAASIENEEFEILLDEVRQWISLRSDSVDVLEAFFLLVLTMLKAGVSFPVDLAAEVSSWTLFRPDDPYLRWHLLLLTEQFGDSSAITAAQVVRETRAWLRDHPDDIHVRARLLDLLRTVPENSASEVVAETWTWLRDHPDDTHVRVALLAVVRAVPGSAERRDVVAETRAWLRDHPDDTLVRAALLGLVRAVRESPVGEVIAETRVWLRGHPGDGYVRATLLGLVRAVPDSAAAEEVIAETWAWLRDHPDDAQVRAALLGVVRAVPESLVREVTDEIWAWLRDHPDDAQVRAALLGVVQAVPESAAAEEVVDGGGDGPSDSL